MYLGYHKIKLYLITQRNLLTNEHNVILISVYTLEED